MHPRSRPTAICVAYVVLHLAAQLSARWFEIGPGISLWYPPCGLALGLLVLLGPRYAPVVFGANVAAALMLPGGLPEWWAPWLFPALITANYSAVAAVVRRTMHDELLPGTFRGTLAFAVMTILAPVSVAVVGTLVVEYLSHYPPASVLHAMVNWWLGDVTGLLTVFPAAVVFVGPWIRGKPHPALRWRWEAPFLISVAGSFAALIGALWFSYSQSDILPSGTLYICFLPLAWCSLRHGLPGATLATLVLVMGSLVGTRYGVGMHAHWLSSLLFGIAVSVLGLGLGSAVTRRNQALAELSASRARFDRVISGAQLGLWDAEVDTGRITHNEKTAEWLHCAPAELPATLDGWLQTVHASDRSRSRAALDEHLAGHTPLFECEYRIRTKDGRWRWIQSRGSVVGRDENGAPLAISGTHVDVTDRKTTEEAARRLRSIVEATTDFVLTFNTHGHVVYANAAVLRLLGEPALAGIEGRPFVALLPPATVELLQTEVIPTTLKEGAWHGELTLVAAPDRTVVTSVVAMAHRDHAETSLLSLIMRDITALKQAEAANLERERDLLRVQKAESLGVLAGGVAHDFNNLLTAILGNAAILRDDHPGLEKAAAPLAQIEIAATRAAELCRTMLTYAGRVRVTLDEVNLNRVVTESVELVQATISKKIRVHLELAENLSPVKGCAAQLQQIVINLALNANEAIGEREGTITVRTFARTIAAEALPKGDLRLGPYVMLEVQDTGCGITREVMDKIFEPFFTTKQKGHGLGLSAAHGIVKAHGGAIVANSQPGIGSTFRIVLPAYQPAVNRPEPTGSAPARWQGSGLALIVDDEDSVRTVVALLIERLGFSTITAKDGAEAVEMFRAHAGELRFVLTDLSMPRMTGDEAMAEMRRINPAVPVVLMSGYPEKMTADHFALASPSALLAKPLRLDVLEKTIRQVLTSASPAVA